MSQRAVFSTIMQLPLAFLPAHRRVELPGTSLSSSPVDRVRSLPGLAPPTTTYTAIRPAGVSPHRQETATTAHRLPTTPYGRCAMPAGVVGVWRTREGGEPHVISQASRSGLSYDGARW
jgi:hypothetical protein